MPPTPKRLDVNDVIAAGLDLETILDAAEEVHPGDDALNAAMAEAATRPELAVVAEEMNLTDKGNSLLLVQLFGRDIRWSGAKRGGANEAEGWMRWTGARWEDDERKYITRAALRIGGAWRDMAPAENADLVLSEDEQQAQKRRAALLKHAAKCESAGSIRAMISLATAHESINLTQADFDQNHWLFNTPTLTYDLKSETSYAPRRGDHITRLAGTAADGDADCPVWRRFLATIMGGDAELVAFLQRYAGYCMTGSIREQKVAIAYGKGANGKSTFMNVLKDILGDYYATTGTETFIDRKAGGIPNDLAALSSARVVVVSEPEEGAPLAEGLIKRATGGDPINARFLNREFFSYVPQFKLWILTNHKPIIKGTDKGIWRRILLIPFTVTIPDEEQDQNLGEKLRAEYPAILRWMLDGLKAWNAVGLSPPRAVADATASYRSEMDLVGEFLEDRCRVGDVPACERAQNKDLYASYVEWAEEAGLHAMSQKAFTRKLIDRGLSQDPDRSQGRRWVGLQLTMRARSKAFGGGWGARRDADA